MSAVAHLNQLVQVRRRRSKGFATVDLVNPDGSIRRRDRTQVVRFPKHVREVASEGSVWRLSGEEREHQFTINGVRVTEYTIIPNELTYQRPSGRLLARWISVNIKGIGGVIANRLVRLKGLDQLIQDRDTEALLAVAGMSTARVERLIEGWPEDDLHLNP